jgi:heat shock protein HslJ
VGPLRVTIRRLMRVVLPGLAASVVVLLVAACGGGEDSSSELVGVPWRWGAVVYGEADPTAPPTPIQRPDDYLLTLAEDGSFSAKADCNSVRGTYALSGSDLMLELGPTTKAACGMDSFSADYIDLLREVASYDVYAEDSLALGLARDAGHMYFYAGAASPP